MKCRVRASCRMLPTRASWTAPRGASTPYTGPNCCPRDLPTRRDAPQGPPAPHAAVLRDSALSLQLPAAAAGALAGGHAQPPDPQRRLLRPGAQRLPAQRHVHLPALLRRLQRLRAAAGAGGGLPPQPQPAPGPGAPRRPAGPRAQAVLRARALPALPALPERAP